MAEFWANQFSVSMQCEYAGSGNASSMRALVRGRHIHRNTFSVGRRDVFGGAHAVSRIQLLDWWRMNRQAVATRSQHCSLRDTPRRPQTRTSPKATRCWGQLESACCDGGQCEIDVCVFAGLSVVGVFLLRRISDFVTVMSKSTVQHLRTAVNHGFY